MSALTVLDTDSLDPVADPASQVDHLVWCAGIDIQRLREMATDQASRRHVVAHRRMLQETAVQLALLISSLEGDA